MTRRVIRVGLAGVLLAGTVRAGYLDTGFDGYLPGTAFDILRDGWQANTSAVVVTEAERASLSNSVVVPGPAVFSNAVEQLAPATVWTQVRLKPALKTPEPYVVTNASFVQYFNLDGHATILTGGVWRTCSNDVWGVPVAPASPTNWVDVAVYQDYAQGRQALFLNGRLVAQDLPFAASLAQYRRLTVDAIRNDTYLDDVRIQPTFDAGRLTNDCNLNGLPDAAELQTHGYCGRTLYVGVGQPFTNLQAAVDVYRPLDTLYVVGGTFDETVVIGTNVIFGGLAFTNNGSIVVGAGGTLIFSNQAASAALSCTGTVRIGSGQTLTLGSLAMGTNGQVESVGGRLVVVDEGLDMTGTFAIAGADWGQDTVKALPFAENFERYSDGMRMQGARFAGWGASGPGVVVSSGRGVGGSKAAKVPVNETLSNRVASADTQVWTEFYGRLARGYALYNIPTGTTAAASCLDTNGWLNVWSNGEWVVCSNDVVGGAVDGVSTDALVRVDVCTDYTTRRYALFLNGRLLREQMPFASASVDHFSRLVVRHGDGRSATYVDQVVIATNVPSGMTNDLDDDTALDVNEVATLGSIRVRDVWYQGSIFKFR